jgi:hypothetical protein
MLKAANRRESCCAGAIFGALVTAPESSFVDWRDTRRRFSSKIGALSLLSFTVVLCLRMRFFLSACFVSFRHFYYLSANI